MNPSTDSPSLGSTSTGSTVAAAPIEPTSAGRHALFENILAAAAEIMVCVDAQQRIVYANVAAEKAFGYGAQELQGLALSALIPSAARERHEGLVRNFSASRGAVLRPMAGGRVVSALRKDGAEFPFEVTLTRLEAGPWTAAIGRDVSERQAAAAVIARQDDELRANALTLEAMREAERGRLARELHDNLGGTLAAMKLDVAWVEQHATSGDGALAGRLQQLRECIDAVAEALRKMSSELRPLMLDDLGLAATLEWLAQRAHEQHGLKVTLRCAVDDMDLPAPLPSSLFRIAEETLAVLGGTATLRDAQVAVERSDGAVQIVVRAEGVPPAGTSLASALPGVYERAALFGGHVAMERDARGISVRVIVPLEPDVGKDEVPHEVPHQ